MAHDTQVETVLGNQESTRRSRLNRSALLLSAPLRAITGALFDRRRAARRMMRTRKPAVIALVAPWPSPGRGPSCANSSTRVDAKPIAFLELPRVPWFLRFVGTLRHVVSFWKGTRA